jgi:dedicator of cytokinesis protein 3
MIAVSVKIFRGDVSTVVRENISLLQDTPLTMRLGFPDVVFPGDERNEIYIKLWSGDFSSATTANARLSVAGFGRGQMGPSSNNVQVSMEVRDGDGRIIPDVVSYGSGEPPQSTFHSMVFQRNAQPTYGELIKLRLPSQAPPAWHLFFTFRNRGGGGMKLGGKGDLQEKPFAFAFLPLFPEKRMAGIRWFCTVLIVVAPSHPSSISMRQVVYLLANTQRIFRFRWI